MSSVKSAQSILRRPSITGKCSAPSSPQVPAHGLNMGSPMQVRAVHFEPPTNLRDLLIRASNEKSYNPKLLEELEGHLTHLKNQRGQVNNCFLIEARANLRVSINQVESNSFFNGTHVHLQYFISHFSYPYIK